MLLEIPSNEPDLELTILAFKSSPVHFTAEDSNFKISSKITPLVHKCCCIYHDIVVYCVCDVWAKDGWTPPKEVTLKDMTSDEQYDADTVYGEWHLAPDSCLLFCLHPCEWC